MNPNLQQHFLQIIMDSDPEIGARVGGNGEILISTELERSREEVERGVINKQATITFLVDYELPAHNAMLINLEVIETEYTGSNLLKQCIFRLNFDPGTRKYLAFEVTPSSS